MGWYGSWTLGELVDAYEIMGSTSVCDGDTKSLLVVVDEKKKGAKLMSNKNEVFEYLIDQLRQQVNNNPCKDLSHEVQSLKNQLRDASAQIKELHLALAQATGDVEAYKLIRKGGGISGDPTPSEPLPGCINCSEAKKKECVHNWRFVNGKAHVVCINCGVTKSGECEHDWYFYDIGTSMMCKKCGLKK